MGQGKVLQWLFLFLFFLFFKIYLIYLIFNLFTFSVGIFYWSNTPHKSSIALNHLLKNSRFFASKVDYLPSKHTCFSFWASFPILLLSFLTCRWPKAWIGYNLLITCIFTYQMEAQLFPSVCTQCQSDSCSAPSWDRAERHRDVLPYKWDLQSYACQDSVKALSNKVSEGEKKKQRANYQAALVNKKNVFKIQIIKPWSRNRGIPACMFKSF